MDEPKMYSTSHQQSQRYSLRIPLFFPDQTSRHSYLRILPGQVRAHGAELEEVALMLLHHHERFDGRGYPVGLKGDEIPYGARIISVTDAFDAMTSDRPYRASIGVGAAVHELTINAGTQFDRKSFRRSLIC